MQHGRSGDAEGVHERLVQGARALAAAEHEQHGPLGRQLKAGPRLPAGNARARAGGDRPPRDAVPRRVAALERVGEEDPAGERRRESVGEPEVRVGFHQRRGNPPHARREDDRPGHVAAAAEDDVRPPPAEDARRSERCGRVDERRAGQPERGPPRQPLHRECVERVARLRNEPGFDSPRRPGEGHRHFPLPQRLGDGERRSEMTERPSGRDQAPELCAFRHGHRRC